MKVAVMGYGTVGSGVVEVIETHKKSISNRIRSMLALRKRELAKMDGSSRRSASARF